MAGARAAAAASAGSSASSGTPQPQEPGLGELLEEFSRTQYRAKDCSGTGGSKVERIEKRCLELFGRDYCYSVIQNVNGDICGHYPQHIVFLEYESSEKEKDTFQSTVQVSKLQDLVNRSKTARCRGRFVCPVILFKGKHICRSATLAGWGELYGRTGYNYIFSGGADDAWADAEDVTEEDCALRSSDTHLFDKVRGYDIKLLRYLSVKYICDLMVENKKVKFGMNVTSSEKVDKAQRYADFTLLSIPYPGCEFFKEYKDRDYMAEGLIFNWKQDYVDAPLSIPDFLTCSLNIDWSQYQSWDLVQQTQNYLKLLLSIINSDDDSGLLVHCISGWDRTPLFISLLRLSLWADGLIHASLKPAEILYLTVAYDWFLFGHMLVDRLSKGEEIFFFCFNFLKHIISEEFSALKIQRRKSLPARDAGFTVEDICMLRRKDRGSTTSLGSDFSLVMESSPGATGSFTYETVELVPAGAQTQAAWRKSHSSSPQSVFWNRPQPSEDRLPSHQALVEAKSSSSSSSNHSDNFFRLGSSPLEVPKPRSVDHPLPGSSLSTDFGSWQMVTGCGSIQERAVLHTDSSLPFSFPDELPNNCLLTALSERETRLQEVRSAFLAAYSSTVGLRAAAPSPSGAIGLLEQFVRGVGLRGTGSSTL
ncbi:phosphatidylinositol-3,5-bisphosphate 3-phosphatase MTMR14 isoform X1 [Physeter macrocephalus]|uniref:Phosphatidylinositol-3,5-bisphosphate 3-phosphatase MTMR14 isoform X1 n=1 Tax=Physeter macrocephalus TaxID=9755 RepID=A0A2Y9FFP6_PHYMC|nr:myotubularin-related protein 14 isoform X1 [Physeter catodon]|eukprot:XP_007121861.1 myotubularin-related protein 14 isoform X1 [Physeter catodon]